MTADATAECVRQLARAARETSYVAMDNAALHHYLQEQVVDRLARTLTAEPFGTAPAYALGADLVAAHFTGPEMAGRLVKVLGGRLLADLGLDREPYRERLAALLGAVVTNYARSLRSRTLDDQEDILRAALSAHDEAEAALRRSEERRWQDARTDRLTGLPNRLGVVERLDEALAAAGDRRVGLAVLDLDRFHALNDTLGPVAADALLAAVGRRLAEHADGHLVGRIGGDEFAVLVTGTLGPEDLVEVAAAVLAALEGAPLLVGATPLTVTASAGLVERPAAGVDGDELLRAADIALTWSKSDGSGGWQLFDTDRNAVDTARWLLAAELPAALRDGQLVVHYQPMIGLSDGRPLAVEALVRWQHPVHGLLLPGRFIPSAEETGLIVPLGRQVLAAACAEAAGWAALTDDPPLVSVNLAARQTRTPGLVEDVLATLAATGLPPERLQLEVTETAMMHPADVAVTALAALAAVGVRIAVDDFGTGHANHTYLRQLPLHELKLAAEFVTKVGGPDGDRLDQQLAAGMIQLGHTLGLTVTAEGVETAAQADWLRAAGCDTVQGWHFGAAVPAADLRLSLGRAQQAV